jgi:CheY-like chemotaxis protein
VCGHALDAAGVRWGRAAGIRTRGPERPPGMNDDKNKILFVEDDTDIRDTLTEILQEEGYAVEAAGHGQEALDKLKGRPLPALILLDLMMPVMNGWQFRAAQLADPQLASIPVVVVSASSNIEQSAAALEAAAFVRKPVVLDQLLRAVHGALG